MRLMREVVSGDHRYHLPLPRQTLLYFRSDQSTQLLRIRIRAPAISR